MDYTEKVIKQSNYWYNDGLNRANFRDLSGAIISLKRSLQYCRHNISARNLLGLVYYGRGEVNEALVEWIISKNLKPRDNIANYFIRKVQNSPKKLDMINSNIKKYNQCLVYCQQDAEDLALIQIKKVVAAHPTFVKAYQLMALLCIRKEQYTRAKQILKRAHKIDTTDALTLYYTNELEELKASGKHSHEDKNMSVSYTVGNEVIIQPTSASLKENAGNMTILNIVIGIMIGAAVVAFLIRPAILADTSSKNADAIREYSAEIDAQKAQINALSTELDTYRATSDEAEASVQLAEQTLTSYEMLLKAEEQLAGEMTSNVDMAATLKEVNENMLSEQGLELYEVLADEIFGRICSGLYESAVTNFEAENYAAAITDLEEIMTMVQSYEGYQAMLLLAQSYSKTNDVDNASTYYNLIISDSTNTERKEEATIGLENISSSASDVTEESVTTEEQGVESTEVPSEQ